MSFIIIAVFRLAINLTLFLNQDCPPVAFMRKESSNLTPKRQNDPTSMQIQAVVRFQTNLRIVLQSSDHLPCGYTSMKG